MKEKLEYFLNAVHYCIYLEECWSQRIVNKFFKKLLSPIPKYLFTDSYREKYYKRLESQQKELDDYFFSKEAGQSIGLAHHLFGYFSTCYLGYFSFTFCGLYKYLTGEFSHGMLKVIIMGIPIAIGFVPFHKAVFAGDRYLEFFREFEKRDDVWRRKWKWITVAYCVGGIIVAVLGFFTMAFLTGL